MLHDYMLRTAQSLLFANNCTVLHLLICLVSRSMAEALAETKEKMVSELYRVLTVDLMDRIKVTNTNSVHILMFMHDHTHVMTANSS
jgi:hypothetical protein